MNSFVNFFNIMQKKQDFNNIERTIYINSKDYDKALPYDEFHRTIRVPNLDERYSNISLLSASISNTFPTIQKEINDAFILQLEGYKSYINAATGEISNLTFTTYKEEVKIDLGYYNQEDMLEELEMDFQSELEIVKEQIIYKVNEQTDMFSLNRSNKLEMNFKVQYLFALDDEPSNEINFFWIRSLKLIMPNGLYKLMGGDHIDYTCEIFDMPIKQNEITVANVTNGLFLDPCSFTFPCRPSLLTCTELQVRLDTVNADQDSNILAYIPLEKFQEGYIVCHNLYPKLTAKRIGYHQNDLVVLSLSQEDNFAISLDEVTIVLEVLVF